MLGAAVAGILGSWLGSAYSQSRMKLRRAQTEAEGAQAMAAKAGGIAVGRKFPDFPLWSADDSSAVSDVVELLPVGGLLVSVVSSCQTCLDVAVSLQQARELLGKHACGIVLLLNGQPDDTFLSSLQKHGVDIPVYVDAQQLLTQEYSVLNNPTYFMTDAAGFVRFVGSGPRTPEELSEIINEH